MARILVLCIDRDNDLGEKAGIKGPVVGERACLKAAKQLLLVDPTESDGNAIYAAIKLKRSLPNSQVAILTGDRELGLKSDMAIREQLQEVLKRTNAKEAIVVSDGTSDEIVLPVIQSLIPITSVQRVVVRQSENVETSYYLIKSYWKELLSKPEQARVVLGLPAIALIILAIFGSMGLSFILFVVGLYLLVRAFNLEGMLASMIRETSLSLRKGRASFLLYVLALVLFAVGIVMGYRKAVSYAGVVQPTLAFINSAIPSLFLASLFFFTGKFLNKRVRLTIYSRLLAISFGVSLILYHASEYLLTPSIGTTNLTFAVITSFAVLIAAILLERLRKRL